MKRLLTSRMTTFIPSVVFGGFLCLSTQAAWTTILFEGFDKCTTMTGGTQTGQPIAVRATNVIPDFNAVDLGDWPRANVFCATNVVNGAANALIGLGSGNNMGWIETPLINLSGGNGDFTVTFKAGAWSGDSASITGIYVLHNLGNGVIRTNTVSSLSATEMKTFVVNGTGGTANSSIRFSARQASNNRFFLDDVHIEAEASTLHIGIAEGQSTSVLAGQAVTATVVASDDTTPILAEIDDTNIPSGSGYSFDGEHFNWVPQVTGNFWVKFVATNEADSVDCVWFFTVGLPDPNAPMVQTTPGSIYLTWDSVPGATNYTVQAYKLATEIEVFAGDFSACRASGSLTWTANGGSGSALSGFGSTVLNGWTGDRIFGANATNGLPVGVTNHLLRIGASGVAARGWVQTPPMDLSGNGGECTLTFRAGKWTNDHGEMDVLHIYEEAGVVHTNTPLRHITGLSQATMTKYTVQVTGGTANSMICFTGITTGTGGSGNNRFFLDDVRLSYITKGKFEVPDAQIVYLSDTTARVFGLPQYSEYLCAVTAMGHIGDKVSPEVSARTTAATVIIVR